MVRRFSVSSASAGMVISGVLLTLTVASGVVLSSSGASAEEAIIDTLNVKINSACTLSGTGTGTHNGTVNPGAYVSEIGTTTLKAMCNDANGFSIYAAGYTGNIVGGTNSNKLVGRNNGGTIASGIATSGDTSNWAMKLTTDSTATYPITITSAPNTSGGADASFASYHVVPNEYTKVATRTQATDVGVSATGSTLTTTYATFISAGQVGDTYDGKVIYTLVHPNFIDNLDDAITVVYEGNGLRFPDGSTSNTVKYANYCMPSEYAYVGNNYQEVKTSNISAGGTQNGAYASDESISRLISFSGADKLKIVVKYGISSGFAAVAEGDWDGVSEQVKYRAFNSFSSGEESFIINGSTATIMMNSFGTPETDYDYGLYVKVYPVYKTEQPNTTGEELPPDCAVRAISGSYYETEPWKEVWLAMVDGGTEQFRRSDYDASVQTVEDIILEYLTENYDSLEGGTITIWAKNPYLLAYDGNGATSDFGMGMERVYNRDYGNILMELSENNNIILLAPNYKRNGHGFIGWSLDSGAASHLNSAKIYGPSETIEVDSEFLAEADEDKIVTLYAIWLPSAGSIQNWSGCSGMSVGGVTALTDSRDNNTYAVAKLEDGNCWMIENMRLGGDSPMTLTVANTQTAGVLPANTTSWGSDRTSQNLDAANTIEPPSTVVVDSERSYAFGNYYSWATAINSTEDINSGSSATTSICPAGWILPNQIAYQDLISSFGNGQDTERSQSARMYPNNYVYSGNIENGLFDNYVPGGTRFGAFWSSTTGSNDRDSAEVLGINNWSVSVDNVKRFKASSTRVYKRTGFPVRCLVDNS